MADIRFLRRVAEFDSTCFASASVALLSTTGMSASLAPIGSLRLDRACIIRRFPQTAVSSVQSHSWRRCQSQPGPFMCFWPRSRSSFHFCKRGRQSRAERCYRDLRNSICSDCATTLDMDQHIPCICGMARGRFGARSCPLDRMVGIRSQPRCRTPEGKPFAVLRPCIKNVRKAYSLSFHLVVGPIIRCDPGRMDHAGHNQS